MSVRPTVSRDDRVLFLAPTARDAAITRELLEPDGVSLDVCGSMDVLVRRLHEGAAAVMLPEEAVALGEHLVLSELLAAQPPWSDLPVLVLTRPGADSAELTDAIATLGNVTLLERPLRVATLLSAVRTALRARERQYQIRGHLAERARTEESLRIADRRKDEFIATLGHELRNPLAPLVTGLELLKLSGVKEPVALRVSAVMERQVSHLIRLVNDLLEVSRITRGVIEVRRDALDLGLIVRGAIEASRPAIEAARHTLTTDLPEESVIIAGDSVRLTQVFANLLTNAIKYTNTGGRIDVAMRVEDERVTVVVRDSGVGIPPDQLASVFDMFMQVDRSSRKTQGGLGIGLTLVRSLVEMHGGRVEARSAGADAGSQFIVELPVFAAAAAEAADAATPSPLPSRRVLVVDDNRDAAETLGDLLGALGATVSVAYSGRAALAALDSFEPDAVVLDVGMPGMDGYEVARRIREDDAHGETLIIALTGWGQEHDHQRSREAGMDHHLVKPPDLQALRELLSETPSTRSASRGGAGRQWSRGRSAAGGGTSASDPSAREARH